MPAIPRLSVIIDVSPTGSITITRSVKADSQAAKANDGYLVYKNNVTDPSVSELVSSTIGIFSTLPMESPRGGEDVYKFDTSINIISQKSGFNWQNLPNQGCDVVPSTVKPTDAQKKAFKDTVDKIINLAEKHAVQSVQQ